MILYYYNVCIPYIIGTIHCDDIIIVQERIRRLAYAYLYSSQCGRCKRPTSIPKGFVMATFIISFCCYSIITIYIRCAELLCSRVYKRICSHVSTYVLLYDPFSSADVFYGVRGFSGFSATVVEQR